ncbi:unnamed protein product [Prunus armeniaca]|uniref:Uncharacterized protein n=1 Tax=Prunus armeniaca TaxID=36596 RepID=A0A6J5UC44_PRUAR|nr:unnamed protein product [Prunus armeniaca]
MDMLRFAFVMLVTLAPSLAREMAMELADGRWVCSKTEMVKREKEERMGGSDAKVGWRRVAMRLVGGGWV